MRDLRRSGTGPGAITPDGCPVEVHSRLRPGRERDIVDGAIPAASTVLELGGGAGRIANALAAKGHRVTVVDESADMLGHVRERRPSAPTSTASL